eukprot:1176267-Prorocentrum_minimum.AAC.1
MYGRSHVAQYCGEKVPTAVEVVTVVQNVSQRNIARVPVEATAATSLDESLQSTTLTTQSAWLSVIILMVLCNGDVSPCLISWSSLLAYEEQGASQPRFTDVFL